MTTSRRENDTLYLDLMDYTTGYIPEKKVPIYMIERFLDRFDISEEGDTTITGSQSDWVLFMSMLLEHFHY